MNEIALAAAKSVAEAGAKASGNKIAEAISVAFPFCGLRKKAVDVYVSDIENSNMPPETKAMLILNTKKTFKELENQFKIATIAQASAKEDTDFSKSSDVDDDWLARYMDSAKFVSNEEMQLIWGNILAKEFEEPGSTSPQITRILAEITPPYARAFKTLCNLTPTIVVNEQDKYIIKDIIIYSQDEFLHYLSINFAILCELENLGLIKLNSTTNFVQKISKKEFPELRLCYGKNEVTIVDYPDRAFPRGSVIITEAGRCIANIIEEEEVEGYWANLVNYLKNNNVDIRFF